MLIYLFVSVVYFSMLGKLVKNEKKDFPGFWKKQRCKKREKWKKQKFLKMGNFPNIL